VKLLVEQDEVIADSKDNDGRTSLSWAVGGGHEAVVRFSRTLKRLGRRP
jgi:ankyrin repeat protein